MASGKYFKISPEKTKARLKILKKLQALSLERKLFYTHRVIEDSMAKGRGLLLYSGGKDSTILKHILLKIDPEILVMFNNTGLNDPGYLEFLRSNTKDCNFIETQAEDPINMWQRLGHWPILAKRSTTRYKKAYPKLKCSSRQCCYNLKEKYANKIIKERGIAVVFWGNRAAESDRRKLSFIDNGYLFKLKKYPWYQSYPLQHWTNDDVLKYINKHIPNYPMIKNFESGCICCGTDLHYYPNNLSRLYNRDRASWAKYMRTGMGANIMIANGLDPAHLEKVMAENPKILLRIKNIK